MVEGITESMVLTDPGNLELREFTVPEITGEDGLLEVEMTSVCGGDVAMYDGKIHQDQLPLLLGHEVVGRVVEMGDEAVEKHGVDIGERVIIEPYIPCYKCKYCQTGYYQLCEQLRCYGVTISPNEPPHLWGGYGSYLYIAPNAKLHTINEDVPADAACLSSVMGNGVRWAMTKGEIEPNDSVAVIGPGVQGLASVLVSSIAGADPIVLIGLPTDGPRLQIGKDVGATETIVNDNGVTDKQMQEVFENGLADVVIVTAPSTEAIELGCRIVAPLGRIVVPAVTGGKKSGIDFDELIFKEADIRTGLGQANDMTNAIAVVEKYPELVRKMITHEFTVANAEDAIRRQIPSTDEFDSGVLHASLTPEKPHSK